VPSGYIMPRARSSQYTTRAAFCLLIFFCGINPGLSDPLDFNSDDTVTVTAERAWEGEEIDVVHFSGQFELRAPDWYLFGDAAVVYGNLENPDRVIVTGKPARISFLRDSEDDRNSSGEEERVDGTAAKVEYFRATDKLIMHGRATLTRKDSTLTSEEIEYDVDTDRYSAGGAGGINIQFTTDDD
jgi:lipopolysaccharide transport protein LptA